MLVDIPHACLTIFHLQINQAILGIHGVDVQFSGVNFLESLVYTFLKLFHFMSMFFLTGIYFILLTCC